MGWLGWQRQGLSVHTVIDAPGVWYGMAAAVNRDPGTPSVSLGGLLSVSLEECDGGDSFEHWDPNVFQFPGGIIS